MDTGKRVLVGYWDWHIPSDTIDFASRNDSSFFELTDVSVPEPGTLPLLAAGIAGIGFLRRRKKSADQA